MKYTVIVGRPDYVSDDQLRDTFMTSLEAGSPAQAGKRACEEAHYEDNCQLEEPEGSPDDYVVIAVIEGEHHDVKEN